MHAKETFCILKKDRLHSHKSSIIHAKKPRLPLKEHYLHLKETYKKKSLVHIQKIHAKEPYCTFRFFSIHLKEPYYTSRKAPVTPQRNPFTHETHLDVRPIIQSKEPRIHTKYTHAKESYFTFKKDLLYTQKSLKYTQKKPRLPPKETHLHFIHLRPII